MTQSGGVSASGYRFLHTLFENHFMGAEEFLIPCCGHTMIPSQDKKSVSIIGCNNGIDFDIVHEQEKVIIKTTDSTEYTVSFVDYKNAVLSFAKQVEDFYKSNSPRKFENDFDKCGYNAFVTEWFSLYDKAVALTDNVPQTNPITFDDYDACIENEIMSISKEGISLKSFHFINFKECAYNFKRTKGGAGKCVGEREIVDLSFTFYTSPKPITIKFIAKNKFFEFLSKNNTTNRFHSLQERINSFGYSTSDMS